MYQVTWISDRNIRHLGNQKSKSNWRILMDSDFNWWIRNLIDRLDFTSQVMLFKSNHIILLHNLSLRVTISILYTLLSLLLTFWIYKYFWITFSWNDISSFQLKVNNINQHFFVIMAGLWICKNTLSKQMMTNFPSTYMHQWVNSLRPGEAYMHQ